MKHTTAISSLFLAFLGLSPAPVDLPGIAAVVGRSRFGRDRFERRKALEKGLFIGLEELRPYALREIYGAGGRYRYDEICGVVVIWTKDRW